MGSRLYAFHNWRVAGQAPGIQTAHSIAEMSIKYPHDSEQYMMYWDWVQNGKTIVILNGGDAVGVQSVIELLETIDLPHSSFREDAGLNFCLTNAAVVVPEYIWRGAAVVTSRGNPFIQVTTADGCENFLMFRNDDGSFVDMDYRPVSRGAHMYTRGESVLGSIASEFFHEAPSKEELDTFLIEKYGQKIVVMPEKYVELVKLIGCSRLMS